MMIEKAKELPFGNELHLVCKLFYLLALETSTLPTLSESAKRVHVARMACSTRLSRVYSHASICTAFVWPHCGLRYLSVHSSPDLMQVLPRIAHLESLDLKGQKLPCATLRRCSKLRELTVTFEGVADVYVCLELGLKDLYCAGYVNRRSRRPTGQVRISPTLVTLTLAVRIGHRYGQAFYRALATSNIEYLSMRRADTPRGDILMAMRRLSDIYLKLPGDDHSLLTDYIPHLRGLTSLNIDAAKISIPALKALATCEQVTQMHIFSAMDAAHVAEMCYVVSAARALKTVTIVIKSTGSSLRGDEVFDCLIACGQGRGVDVRMI